MSKVVTQFLFLKILTKPQININFKTKLTFLREPVMNWHFLGQFMLYFYMFLLYILTKLIF